MSLSKLPISDRALDELYALFSPLATAEALKNAFPKASKREAAIILKKPARKPEAPQAAPDSVRVPLKEVFENKKLFQNRQTDYSGESRDRIIAAVEEGKFRWSIFDPITLWRNPQDGKLYILSGHSRTAAFRELAKSRPEFATIPARIEENATLEQAIEIARNSNTLSTKETDVERALYYASLRPATPEREIMQLIERQEGANASRIKKFSFLSPRGKALQNAQAFQGSDATNRNAANELAEWVGEARRRYPQLTNAHENELTEWLLSGAKSTLRTQTDFLTKVEQAVQKNTEFGTFYPERILNMNKAVQRNTGEEEWETLRRDLEKQVNETKKVLDDKRLRHTEVLTEEVRKGTATPERLEKLKAVIKPYEEAYTAAQLRLIAHNNQKDTFRQEGKKQAALFGVPTFLVENMDGIEGMKAYVEDGSVQLIVADPPYFLGMTHNGKKGTFSDLNTQRPFYVQLFEQYKRVLTDTGCLFFFCDWKGYAFYYAAMQEVFEPTNLIVWNKGAGPGNKYGYHHEFIIFATLDKKLNQGGSNVWNVPGFSNAKGRTEQIYIGVQKPMPLIERIVKEHSEKGDLVLDTFLGSGTTAVAAANNGRAFVGFEIDPKNYRIAQQRIEKEVNS